MTTKAIKQHEDKCIHIRKVNLVPLLGIIIFTLLAIGNYQLIDKKVIKTAFSNQTYLEEHTLGPKDLINIYPIFGEYILISLIIISMVSLFKGGYKKLKSYSEEGLIAGLIRGLIGGLIAGLIFGLIVVLIGGLIAELIFALIAGLIFGLIVVLIVGLIGEFRK